MNASLRYLKDVLLKYARFIWSDYAKLDEVDLFCLPNEEKSLENRILFVLFFPAANAAFLALESGNEKV